MRKRASGMTLVEILIAVAVIAILSAIAIPAYEGYITSSRQNTARINARTLALFMENYYERQCDTGACTYKIGTASPPYSYVPGSTPAWANQLGWDPTDGNPSKDKFKYLIETCASDPIDRCYKITVKDAASDTLLIEEEYERQ